MSISISRRCERTPRARALPTPAVASGRRAPAPQPPRERRRPGRARGHPLPSRAVRIFDGHNDVLARLHAGEGTEEEFLGGGGDGHLDLPRARAGGLAGGLFAIFPADPFTGEADRDAVDYRRAVEPRVALADTPALTARLPGPERPA